jgi:hypothetical protein
MGHYLLIDGGQSGCRIVYVADGERVGSGGESGLTRQTRDRVAGLLRVLERAFADIEPLPSAVDVVVAGLTGFDDSSETARTITDGMVAVVYHVAAVVGEDGAPTGRPAPVVLLEDLGVGTPLKVDLLEARRSLGLRPIVLSETRQPQPLQLLGRSLHRLQKLNGSTPQTFNNLGTFISLIGQLPRVLRDIEQLTLHLSSGTCDGETGVSAVLEGTHKFVRPELGR